jgi:hypothetical protein
MDELVNNILGWRIGMKIKEGFLLREIVDSYIVVPVGQRVVEFNGLISLNDSGAFLWKCLSDAKTEQELVDLLLNNYDIDETTAREDIEEFVSSLQDKRLLEE